MKKILYILGLLLVFSCGQHSVNSDEKEIKVYTICNQDYSEKIDLSIHTTESDLLADIIKLNIEFEAISGEEIIETLELTRDSKIVIKTTQAGIARYRISFSGNEIQKQNINLCIISQLLLDFTQSQPMEPRGSVSGIAYPEDALVKVAKEIEGVGKDGKRISISPGLLVNKGVAPIPHNSMDNFPDFDESIKYYGYKENSNAFSFRYQPLIPMLEVGNGNKNRGVGIIVINKNQIMNNPKIKYEFEGYCSIRTRSDAKETYNLGVVIGTVNKDKVTFKDAVVARDYFNIGYSSSGQIYSEKFSLENDDYLTIGIVGEAGLGGDKKRTTRFEYIKISPVVELNK